MNNGTNIHSLGIQINFPTWERFNLENLTNDGVVFFQYLVFHCQHNAEWTHSDSDIEKELGLKRTRLTTLRKKFTDAGLLQTRIVRNKHDNKITAYRLNFWELTKAEKLKIIYREKTPSDEVVNLSEYSKLYKALHESQPKKDAKVGTNDKKQTSDQWQAKQFAATLEGLYVSRTNEFNSRRKAPSKQVPGKLRFSPYHIQKLTNVLKHFDGDQEYIRTAFIAFTDTLNKSIVGIGSDLLPEGQLRSPLNYFLSYSNKSVDSSGEYDTDNTGTSFAVIYRFGDFFAANYSSQASSS